MMPMTMIPNKLLSGKNKRRAINVTNSNRSSPSLNILHIKSAMMIEISTKVHVNNGSPGAPFQIIEVSWGDSGVASSKHGK